MSLLLMIMRFWPGEVSWVKLEIRYSPKVQLLIWSPQLFSPTLHLLPPPPFPTPSIFLMLFQLQTFRKSGILSQHTSSEHSYRVLLFHLPPDAVPTEFLLCWEVSQIQIVFIGTTGEKPVLLKQITSVTGNIFLFPFCLSPSFSMSFSPFWFQCESASHLHHPSPPLTWSSLSSSSLYPFHLLSIAIPFSPSPLSPLSLSNFVLHFRHLAYPLIQRDCLFFPLSSFSLSLFLSHTCRLHPPICFWIITPVP